jgi:hypothetical protein
MARSTAYYFCRHCQRWRVPCRGAFCSSLCRVASLRRRVLRQAEQITGEYAEPKILRGSGIALRGSGCSGSNAKPAFGWHMGEFTKDSLPPDAQNCTNVY